MLLLLAARAALISLIATTLFLAPSFGHAALYEPYSWSARFVMVGLLVGVWCSFFGYAAARERVRRIAADDAVLTAAYERMQGAIDQRVDVDAGLRALLARTEIS